MLALSAVLMPTLGQSWDTFVWREVCRDFYLRGLTPYEVVVRNESKTYIVMYPFAQYWYAYPPLFFLLLVMFYFPCYLLSRAGVVSVLLENACVKLPCLLGHILLALSARRLVLVLSSDEKLATRVELALLLNPFLLFLSVVWGMFDCLACALLLLATYFVLKRRLVLAGVASGLAACCKQTTWLGLLILSAFVLRRERLQGFVLFCTSLLLTAGALVVPFYTQCPQGFLYAVLLMHARRPPVGYNAYFALTAIVLQLMVSGAMDVCKGLALLNLIGVASSIISFALIALAALSLTMWIVLRVRSANELIKALILTYSLFLIFNKVTNEQYFAYLIALMTTASLQRRHDANLVRRLSIGLLLVSSLGGMRFLSFFLSSLAVELRVRSEYLTYFTWVAGESSILVQFTGVATFLLIIPALAELYKRAVLEFATILRDLFRTINRLPIRVIRIPKVTARLCSKTSTAIALTLLVFLSGMLGTCIGTPLHAEIMPSVLDLSRGGPYIGIFYFWAFNPTHDYRQRMGTWETAKLTPIRGFYETNVRVIQEDMKTFRELGADVIVVEYLPGIKPRLLKMAELAWREGIHLAIFVNITKLTMTEPDESLMVKLSNGTPLRGTYSLTRSTLSLIISEIKTALKLINISATCVGSRPLVVLTNVLSTYPGWSEEEKTELALALIEMMKRRLGTNDTSVILATLSQRWGVRIRTVRDLIAHYPSNMSAFLGNNAYSRDWLDAFIFKWSSFWREVIERLRITALVDCSRANPLLPLNVIRNVFDGVLFLPVSSNSWVQCVNCSSIPLAFPFEPMWWRREHTPRVVIGETLNLAMLSLIHI